jgi:tetratricopeptide (TPR) repeat protein
MPQVFSAGWFYLFLLIMVICAIRIVMKLRDINREPDMEKPVLPVAPVIKESPDLSENQGEENILVEPDHLIKEGSYSKAIDVLSPMLLNLSPVEDRELMGKIQYRLGACQRRIGLHERGPGSLLRSGEALREAVSLFSPSRLHSLQIRALGELAGLYEDLAHRQNPVENLLLSMKTWESAASTAQALGLAHQEAVLMSRSGSALRQLASYAERRANLIKAIEIYQEAISVPEAFPDRDSLFEKAVILKMMGDVLVELSDLQQREENLARAVSAYDEVVEIMTPEKHASERIVTLLDSGRVLLDIYDSEQSPAHLRKALRSLREAVDLVKSESDRFRKGLAMALMGDALIRYADVKDRRENLERAVRFYETALGFLKNPEHAPQRDRIKEGLRKAVEKLERT